MPEGNVLITGIGGFMGFHLAKEIAQLVPELNIIGIDRKPLAGVDNTIVVDLRDRGAFTRIFREVAPRYVFHMAGIIYSNDFKELYCGNVEIVINLLDLAQSSDFPVRVIIPGSAAEYGRVASKDIPITEKQPLNPVSAYGVSKAWQATVARYYALLGVDVVIGRIFNTIGRGAPESLAVGSFASQIKKIARGETPPCIMVGNLSTRRDYIDVADACRGLAAAAFTGKKGEVYNICSGHSIAMADILAMMISKAGISVSVEVDNQRVRSCDIEDSYGSNLKLLRDSGWQPSVAIEKSIEWMLG